jgi:hypothetical protein
MSTAVHVYSVSANRLRAAPGSQDADLLAALRPLEGFFATIDQLAERVDEDDERPPTCATAYRQIVNGEPYADRYGYVYGYAYEGLCLALGAEMERCWIPIAGSSDWFREIDAALAALPVGLKVTDLLYRGSVIALPPPDDFPFLGWWTADEVTAAAGAFRALDRNRLDGETTTLLSRVADAVEDVRSWIAFASERPGDWLIGVES